MDSPQKKRDSLLSQPNSKRPKRANLICSNGSLFGFFPDEIETSILSFLDISDFGNARATSRLWKVVCGREMEKKAIDELRHEPLCLFEAYSRDFEVQFWVDLADLAWDEEIDMLEWDEEIKTKEHFIESALKASDLNGQDFHGTPVSMEDKEKAANLLHQRGWVTIHDIVVPEDDEEGESFGDFEDQDCWKVRIEFNNNISPQQAMTNIVRKVAKYKVEIANGIKPYFDLPLLKRTVVGLLTNTNAAAPIKNAKYEYEDLGPSRHRIGESDFISFKTSDGRRVTIFFRFEISLERADD